MQRHHSQFDRRKNAASSRRLASRHVTHEVSKDFFQQSAVGPNNSTVPSQESNTLGTREQAPIGPLDVTSAGAALDGTALRSLREMFLLLDEWDRATTNNSPSAQHSSEGRKPRGLDT
jgi:hypothetical protein